MCPCYLYDYSKTLYLPSPLYSAMRTHLLSRCALELLFIIVIIECEGVCLFKVGSTVLLYTVH